MWVNKPYSERLLESLDGVRKSPSELRVLLVAHDHTEAVRSGSYLVHQPRFGTDKSTFSSPVWLCGKKGLVAKQATWEA